jgi:hypothetical protein
MSVQALASTQGVNVSATNIHFTACIQRGLCLQLRRYLSVHVLGSSSQSSERTVKLSQSQPTIAASDGPGTLTRSSRCQRGPQGQR